MMNEQIRELARQSGGIDMTNHTAGGITTWVGTGTPEFLERFAELIVRECAELSANSQYTNTKSEYYEGFNEALIYAGNKIKQHFGVEG